MVACKFILVSTHTSSCGKCKNFYLKPSALILPITVTMQVASPYTLTAMLNTSDMLSNDLTFDGVINC